MTALTVPFLLSGSDVPGALVVIGRWVPALASLAAYRAVRHEGSLVDWWGLRPGGPRALLAGVGTALGVSATVAAAGFGILRLAGLAQGAVLPDAGQLLVVALVTTLVASVSTLGEEVAWRSHLRLLTRRHGFWVSALGVGAFWALWHVPLHAAYVVGGVVPWQPMAAGTVVLVAVAPLWAALVERFGSVWPAVVAHAFPVTVPVLVGTAGAPDPATTWAAAGVWGALSLGAAALLRPSRAAAGPGRTKAAVTGTPGRASLR